MSSFIKIALTTCGISLLGALPLGSLNITAFGLTLSDGIGAALLFTAGAILSELIYIRLTWLPLFHLRFQKLNFVQPLLIVMLAVLGIYSLTHIQVAKTESTFILVQLPFISGLLMSSINLLQIPFWMAWNSVLHDRLDLRQTSQFIAPYLIGASIGSGLGFITFIAIAYLFRTSFTSYLQTIQILIGVVYLLIAGWLLFQLTKNQIKIYFAQL